MLKFYYPNNSAVSFDIRHPPYTITNLSAEEMKSVDKAIFNKIPASGFFFCTLLFSRIKKPQPLDFSKDCGAYFTYLALITRLLNDSSNTA